MKQMKNKDRDMARNMRSMKKSNGRVRNVNSINSHNNFLLLSGYLQDNIKGK